LSKIKILENQFSDENETDFRKQNHKNNLSRKYPDKYPYNNINKAHKWPKYQNQYYSASKNINQGKFHEKNVTLNKKLQIHTNKDTENNSKNPSKTELNNENPSQRHEPINNSNNLIDIETKLKKFETQFSSAGRVHNGPVINDSSDRFTGFRMSGQDDSRPHWNNRQKRSFQNNYNNRNNYATGQYNQMKNLDWRGDRPVEDDVGMSSK